MSRLAVWVAALWCCSLGLIGFLVVPMLFAHLLTPAVAGGMAAKLFQAQTWLSVLCGMVLLLCRQSRRLTLQALLAPEVLLLITAGMLLALLSEFGVAPHIVARDNLRLWHGVGSAMFVLQFFCATRVFWKMTPSVPAR